MKDYHKKPRKRDRSEKRKGRRRIPNLLKEQEVSLGKRRKALEEQEEGTFERGRKVGMAQEMEFEGPVIVSETNRRLETEMRLSE